MVTSYLYTGDDYDSSPVTAVIPPLNPIMMMYAPSYSFASNVTIYDDSLVETTESFSILVTPVEQLSISVASVSMATVDIMDDDGEIIHEW